MVSNSPASKLHARFNIYFDLLLTRWPLSVRVSGYQPELIKGFANSALLPYNSSYVTLIPGCKQHIIMTTAGALWMPLGDKPHFFVQLVLLWIMHVWIRNRDM